MKEKGREYDLGPKGQEFPYAEAPLKFKEKKGSVSEENYNGQKSGGRRKRNCLAGREREEICTASGEGKSVSVGLREKGEGVGHGGPRKEEKREAYWA